MAAGVTLGFLKYVLGFDTISFKKGASQADADLAKLQKSFQRSAAKMASLGKSLSIGLTAPLAAFGALSFKAASDAAELQSAFNITFGKMAGDMNKWAEATGDAMGRSTTELMKAANTFGIFFNTAVPPGKAAEMSKTFAKLAVDLGSFFNVDSETALEKLRAGLAGEAEPLRAFGVFINDAAVKAKALELGLGGAHRELTEGEKIQARYALILGATIKAQGDAERTAGSTANQIKRSQAAFQELQIVVGTKLLPVLTPLIEKLASALTWFTSLSPSVQNWVLAIAAASAAAGPFLVALANMVSIFAKFGLLVKFAAGLTSIGVAEGVAATGATAAGIAIRGMLGPIGLAISAVWAIYEAWKHWDQISAIVQRVYTAVKTWLVDKFNAIVASIKSKVEAVTGFFRDMYDAVVGHSFVPDMVKAVGAWFAKLAPMMVAPAQAATTAVNAAFGGLRNDVAAANDDIVVSAQRTTADVIDAFGQMASSTIGSVKDMVATFKSGDILGGIKQFLDLVLNVLQALGQIGVLKGPATTPPIAGTRAAGGPVVPGRTYLVGENGPEFVTPRRSGYVHPNGSGGGAIVRVVPGALFDVIVEGHARRVAAPLAGQAAIMGVGGAEMRAAKRSRRDVYSAR